MLRSQFSNKVFAVSVCSKVWSIMQKGNGKSQTQMISNTRHSYIYTRDFTRCKRAAIFEYSWIQIETKNSVVPRNLNCWISSQTRYLHIRRTGLINMSVILKCTDLQFRKQFSLFDSFKIKIYFKMTRFLCFVSSNFCYIFFRFKVSWNNLINSIYKFFNSFFFTLT
jgi:hypothetical protein